LFYREDAQPIRTRSEAAMMVKESGNEAEAGALQVFAKALSEHLARGTRAKVEIEGEPWTVKQFAAAVGVTERTVRAWLKGEYAPNDLRSIIRELFGDNEKGRADRNELRTLYRLSKGGDLSHDRVSPMTRSSASQGQAGSAPEDYERMAHSRQAGPA
jgi:hypothetical protein